MDTQSPPNSRFFLGAMVIFCLTLLIGGVMIYRLLPAQINETAAASGPTTSPADVVSTLTRQVIELSDRHEYAKALALLDQIRAIDPANEFAAGSRSGMEERMNQLANGIKSSAKPVPEQDAIVLAKLEKKLPEVKFDAVPFKDVVEFLRDVSDVNIFVNWRAINAGGITREQPVTARLRDVKISKALQILLRDLGDDKTKLGYTLDEGVITISTADDLASNVVTNVYDIRDLLVNVSGGPPRGQSPNAASTAKQQLIDEIIKLIQETVAHESWKDNGGKVGSIREMAGQLIVTQTPETQRSLGNLIAQLRETRAIQISIEANLIELTDAFAASAGYAINDGKLTSVGPDPGSMPAPTTQPGNIATDLVGIGHREAEHATLDDEKVRQIFAAAVSRVSLPRVIVFNGASAEAETKTDSGSTKFFVQATASSDRRHVTTTTMLNPKELTTTVSTPDGASVMIPVRREPGSAGRHTWLLLKPTIILQREVEQAQFPIVGTTTKPSRQ